MDEAKTALHFMSHPVAAKRFVEPLAQRMKCEGWRVELWLEDIHGLSAFADNIGIFTRTKRYSFRGNPMQLLSGAFGLWRSLRAMEPRLVEAHQTRDATIPLLIAKLIGTPVRIYHNHGVPYLGYVGVLRQLLRWLEWINCRLATHVLTVSDGMRSSLVLDRVVAASKCRVIGPGSSCGLDVEEFSMASFPEGKSGAKRRSGAAEDSFIALFVGRPERRKGIHRLLDVWQRRMGSNDVLWLAGVSPDRARSISPDHGDNIKAFGYVENLRPLYAAADVVVLPSEHEGFGYALLEGAAMECSLLASRIPGPDALVVDGRNGFLIAVGDDDGLTACLGRLRDDRTLCRWLGQNARLSALRFDRGLILDQYAEYLLQFGKSGIPAESGHL